MNTQIRPLVDISHRATEALIREIGVVDTIRFLGQFRDGRGDYTDERREHYRSTPLDEILRELRASTKQA